MENNQVASFYDKFWADLEARKLGGINSRHRNILRNLKHAGLKKNSRVLEIGCGIGMLTAFIAKAIPGGKITGVDISPESIAFAQKKYASRSNMSFRVDDMTNFKTDEKYDFVVFPDVLEHIPIEAHSAIFKVIRTCVHDNSIVLINIPNPPALEYMHIHYKSELQIIDQPLHTDKFLKAIYDNGFFLEQLTTYPVFFDQPDYQSMIVKPAIPFKVMTEKKKTKLIFKNVLLRLENFFS